MPGQVVAEEQKNLSKNFLPKEETAASRMFLVHSITFKYTHEGMKYFHWKVP